jgi:hypothetical protein
MTAGQAAGDRQRGVFEVDEDAAPDTAQVRAVVLRNARTMRADHH